MAPRALAVLALLALGGFAAGARLTEDKNRPVTKVINLLKDMMKQLEKEGDEDEDIYDKMGCWCVTNEKEKTKSIDVGNARITQLTKSIEELLAESSELNAEIKNLQGELEASQQALDGAGALRAKQLSEFNEDEKDSLTSITSLKAAVVTLSKHNEGALLQLRNDLTDEERIELAASLKDLAKKHRAEFGDKLNFRQMKVLQTFSSLAQQPAGYFDASPTMSQAPASGEIFGVLKQMKEDFETKLAGSQKDEVNNVKAYEDLKAAKESEIAATTKQVEVKTGQAATADEKRASDQEDLEDTQATLAEDTKFLADLKTRCASMDAEFTERTTTRQQEIAAVSKALEFLSSDEAHDLFTRSFNPALLQRESRDASKRRRALVQLLEAKKAQDPRLSAIATQARLDSFAKVKETIKMMIDKLLKEKDDDIKHKDFCIEEFNKNEVDMANKYREKDEVLAEIEDLTSTINELSAAMETLKAEIAELQVQLKRAAGDREKANKEFQAVVADAKATQKLLTASLDILKGFYEKAALVQGAKKADAAVAHSGKQAPPPGFKTYENSAGSGGVMGMMQKIIDESKAMEAEAVRGEKEAQEDYEDFVKDTNEAVNVKSADVVNKSEAKAKAEKDRIAAQVTRDTTLSEIEELEQVNSDLHKSCDFLMKNFDVRVTARDSEIEALKQGIALFSGASFTGLVQNAQ